MKYVKKILRLIPLLFLIGAIISCIVYSNNTSVNEIYGPLEYFNFEGGPWDNFNDSMSFIISNPIFSDIELWISNNISNSYLVIWSFYIMCYELFLSLIFLMFDCINLVFIWANKFINKGVDLD